MSWNHKFTKGAVKDQSAPAVVLYGADGRPAAPDAVADSIGNFFSPRSCSHAYTYDGLTPANVLTDAATFEGVTRTKTYTYTSGNRTTETQWMAPMLGVLTVTPVDIIPGSAAGAVVATITGKKSGSILSFLPNDGRIVVSGNDVDGWKLVTGSSVSAPGAINGFVVETHPEYSDSGKQTAANLTVVAWNTFTTLGLSNNVIATTAAPGTLIGALLNRTAGSTLSISPNDGRLAISGDNLLIGLTASEEGNRSYTITQTKAGYLAQSTVFMLRAINFTLASGTFIEGYNNVADFTVGANTAIAADAAHKIEGTNALQVDALAGASGSGGEAFATKMGIFNVTTDVATDIGLSVSLIYIDADSDRMVNTYGTYFGKVTGLMAGALVSAPVPFGYQWIASHASENATLLGLGTGNYGVRPAARGNSPYGQKVSIDQTYIKVQARPAIILTLDDCLAVQDAHIAAILARGLVATRAIPANSVGAGAGYSTLATLLAQQSQGIALIPNATRNDAAVNTFGNRAAALAEMDASKAACAAMGFDPEGLDYSVWPNGYYTDSAPLKQAAAMTGNGANGNVTFGAAVTWVAGDRVMGAGVPRGTNVTSVAGDGLSAVLTNTIPAQTKPACAVDISGEYARDKFLRDVKNGGKWKMIRGTGANKPFWPWFGPADLDFLALPGDSWTTGLLATCKANMDLAVTRKSALITYHHGDWPSGEMLQVLDYAAYLKSQGVEVLTLPQLGARCMGAYRP